MKASIRFTPGHRPLLTGYRSLITDHWSLIPGSRSLITASRLLPITACLLAAGCSLLAPIPERDRFFTLTALPEAQAHRAGAPREGAGAAHGIVYGLGPIKSPAYLDRREIATRVSPTELTYSQTDRWAEPVSVNVASVLLQNLAELLETDRIAPYPWIGTVKVDYQVEISLLRLERDAAGTSLLTADWAILDARNGRRVVVKETTLTRPGPPGDTAAAVAALSSALGDLSREIATALQALPAPQEASSPTRKHK